MGEATALVGKSKKLITLLAATFTLGILLGALAYPFLTEQTEQLAATLKKLITSEDKLTTAKNIFLKNLQSSFITLILGPAIILPALIVLANGFATGLVMRMAYEKGKTPGLITLSLLPHGIFELPAFFITAAAGMRVGMAFIKPGGEPRIKATARAAILAVKTYITIVIPLLIIAAFMETYVSTQIIQ